MKRKENKSAKIRDLLNKGVSPKDIVTKLGVSPQLVYVVKHNMGIKAKASKPAKVKQPKGKKQDVEFVIIAAPPRVLALMHKQLTQMVKKSSASL
jgi:hypothetical protein